MNTYDYAKSELERAGYFRDPDDSTWTNAESRVEITFPYEVCDPEIVDRNGDDTE